MNDMDRILMATARLSTKERVAVAERILTQGASRRPSAGDRYVDLVSAAERVIGTPLDDSRCRSSVMIRRFVAFRMHKEGYPYMDIASAMGIHHSTVIHHVHIMQDYFDMPLVFADELYSYMQFTEKL